MSVRVFSALLLAVCCTACNQWETKPVGFKLPEPEFTTRVEPISINPNQPAERATLVAQMASKQVLFIGEVHDSLEHHQNQLAIIRALYARYPDLAIGVEYFQKPFQPYLDDYVAGRIDEREMLRKTEYFKRWKIDYRMVQPIFQFARENRIPILALNVTEEIHNKVYKNGLSSLTEEERVQIPKNIRPANQNYLQRLKAIFDTHPPAKSLQNFVDGAVLWDETMAVTTVSYLNQHPQTKMVVLAGLVHVLYGDGIPERVNKRMRGNQSLIAVNGGNFGRFPNVADYVLTTDNDTALPKAGKLGVSLIDGKGSVHVSDFSSASPAKKAGMALGDHIVSLDGVPVTNVAELKALMFDKQPSDLVQLTVLRDQNKELYFDVTLN